MRRIILELSLSLDGYIARPDGSVDFLLPAHDYPMGAFFKTVDTALMGRKTYEVGLKLSGGGKLNMFGLATYVFTRTLPAGQRDGIHFTADPPEKIVHALRQKKGKHLWLMGGGELVRHFLTLDLVDELHLAVVPTLLGAGIPIFPAGFPERKLTLIQNKAYSQGLLSLHYERADSAPKSKSSPNPKSKRKSKPKSKRR